LLRVLGPDFEAETHVRKEIQTEKLAILGGPKAKTSPYTTGKRFGAPELKQLKEALDQNTLFYAMGAKVKGLTAKFARTFGVPYAVATSSGTASIHVALGSVGLTVGDEVITSPITDMGSIIGILYQNAVPIFADLDPRTYNMTAASIEKVITKRTKAILVVHLAGNPCEMGSIMALSRRYKLPVVEDVAQSYMAAYKGRLAGTFGALGAFSLNDFKHISTGDGGVVVTKSKELARRAALFADKYYDRTPGASRFVEWLAPNYRMTELQGAVGIAQLDRLKGICRKRNSIGTRISNGLEGVAGVLPPLVTKGGWHSYWFYMFRVDDRRLACGNKEFAEALSAEGVNASAGYIQTCIYNWPVLAKRQAYPGHPECPFDPPYHATKVRYREGLCPNAEEILRTAVLVPVKEFWSATDVKETVKAIRKVAAHFGTVR
jgi:perosamine synthetase